MALSFTTRTGEATTTKADALIVPVFDGEPVSTDLHASLGNHLRATLEEAGFTGKRSDLAAFPTFGLLPARLLVLTGLGERATIGGETIRRAYGAAVKWARDQGARSVAAMLPDG